MPKPSGSGSQLDSRLVRLGHREAACRWRLGNLAARFLTDRSHHQLGFARLSDYARERLGVSARELQSLAHVATALMALPRVARAFAAGELSWTKVRLLVAVARADSEDRWLVCARRTDTRTLRKLAARETDPAGDRKRRGSAGAEAPAAEDDEDDTLDGEQVVRFRMTCTRGLRRIWHQTVELARCVAGTQAPVWQAAEAIAAEALSGAAAPVSTTAAAPVSVPPPCPDGHRGAEAGRAVSGDPVPTDAAPTDAVPADAAPANAAAADVNGIEAGRDAGCAVHGSCYRDAVASVDGPVTVADGLEVPGMLGTSTTVGVPADRAFASSLTRPSVDAGDGCNADPAALDAGMRAILAELRRLDAEIGVALSAVAAGRLHRVLGFASFAAYARDRLSISAGKARTLLALERRMGRVPALREAYASGTLSWSRALVILPVATAESAAAWVERAGEVTVRRLEAEVAWALDRYDARPEEGMPGPPAAGTDVRLAGALEAGDGARPPGAGAATTCAPAGAAVGSRRSTPPRTGSLPGERQMGAHSMAPGEEVVALDPPLFMADVEITFRAPRSIVVLLHEALAGFARPREPRWRAMARLLAHVAGEWQRQPRHRDPIFARDGWRCAVPACGARRNLHDHHVRYRSRGGDNARDNRVAVCAWHHLRGIHAGRVRASGTAPEGLTWELGRDGAGRAWLRFRGDRYLAGAATMR